jgi:preprotein translocase subunit SecD
VKDKQRAVDLIGKTAELTFRPVISIFDPLDANQRAAAKAVVESSGSAKEGDIVEDTDSTVSLSDLLTPPEEDAATAAVALLGSDGQLGFVLAPAQLTGEVIEEAVATFQGQWIVNLSLNDEGAVGFDQMAVANYERQVAIVLDGVVESAPTINATEFNGQAVISGSFDEAEAKNLALVLRFGALPVEFERDDVRTVSATLGEGTLRAGVIAGLVGLALVGLYMLLYYRLLGLVAICSLAVSGATLWSIIAWLGESKGLALTLAGATGIIVSIGVQVDSNIVYYERIKEEVRRGRAVRSAAAGSFRAAFSTIVWADLASLIGAGVLYQLTSGTVRGFALYLGIATLIDLAVSFFFMRPLVVFVARRLVNERPTRLGLTTVTEEASV